MGEFAGTWKELEVGGHPADVYEPPSASEHGYVLIYLHGVHLGRLVDKAAYCGMFDEFGLRVVAPRTQRSWWTDRICPEFDENTSAEAHVLNRVLPWIAETWDARPPQIGLFGTSMGGQGALRISFKHPNTFPVVAAVSPAIDYHQVFDEYETISQMYDDPEQVRQDTATLHIHPLNWPRHTYFCCDPTDERWFESSDRLHMKLSSLGIPHEHNFEVEEGGHGWPYYSRMAEEAVRFLHARLEQERLRLDVVSPEDDD